MKDKKKVAIDLTWLRHCKVGGTESSIINLLNGIENVDRRNLSFYLITATDNREQFIDYFKSGVYKEIPANTVSENQVKRVLWQNFGLCRLLRKHEIFDCIEPIYSIPFTPLGNVKIYSIIHDLQAYHFPEYFSKARVIWMKLSWKNTINKAFRVIAISDFVKRDIEKHYKVKQKDKLVRIYDAVGVDPKEIADVSKLLDIGVCPDSFYYTVSSLLPHKNLKTILFTLYELKKQSSEQFYPLVISGVGGKLDMELKELISDLGLEKDVYLMGFVDNALRNLLYKTCKAFLFPSVFEGFGMPPVEGLKLGAVVITTNETSIPEVTCGKAFYVKDPYNVLEWIDVIKDESNKHRKCYEFSCYEKDIISKEYINLLSNDGSI